MEVPNIAISPSPLRAFDLLRLLDPSVLPEQTKIHLATSNGVEHPLAVYRRGEFNTWQSWQSRCNFQRPHMLSLISMREPDRWLFAGLHDSHGYEETGGALPYRYHLEERPGAQALNGRLIVRFRRPSRQSYLNADRWASNLLLDEVRAERLSIGGFPGFRHVDLSHADLQLIVRQVEPSWCAALSSVGGVYLISDTKSGQLYVGSASGVGGFWARWIQYADNGHGGNVEFRKLLAEAEQNRQRAFRYSILEIMDVHASEKDIRERESRWKGVLLSRTHGLNGN